MNFEIKRELLDNVLQNVSRGLSTKTPMPILTGIYVSAQNRKLTFITTNKEISIQIVIEESDKMNIIDEGSCVIPGKYFVDIVKKLEGEVVDVTLFDERNIKIISKNTDFTLISYDQNNFPSTLFNLDVESIKLTCHDLKQIVRQTSFACATSENRVILTSVNFTIKHDNLTVIATDSYRLAKKLTSVNSNFDHLQLNIPSKSLDEISKIVPDTNEEVELFVSNNQALFKYKNISFMTRLIEGNYPDTSPLFNKNYYMTVKFNRSELIAAVDKASLFVSEQSISIVKFNFNPNSNEVELSSNATEIGHVVENVAILEQNETKLLQIAFSTKYLLDALKSFDTPEITIYFTGEIKQVIIANANDDRVTQVLLPIRVF